MKQQVLKFRQEAHVTPLRGSLIHGGTRIWKCWLLRRGQNQSAERKTFRSKGENHQQTQPLYLGSFYVSAGKLPTYPSPKPTLTLERAITKVKPHVNGPFITVVVPLFLKSTIGAAVSRLM